jgi:hypothetical protein
MTLAENLNLPKVHWKPEGRPIQIHVVQGDEVAASIDALLRGNCRLRMRQARRGVWSRWRVTDGNPRGRSIMPGSSPAPSTTYPQKRQGKAAGARSALRR